MIVVPFHPMLCMPFIAIAQTIVLPNASSKLMFWIFADDTNIFYSSNDSDELERVINEELGNVLKYCAANMLSINFKKTNYMIIASPKKKIISA